ncbi:hypothetical protein [Pseudarthrobacter sp. BIM B-2242]|uniref:hypothetical protein n=1 Tax=Pseudarthrobacter sp. BIM B-2242 TaxID=2772401 RepID=UPI00168BC4B5|nr:hypothetical protein [Pseudarthrobacter sp. BIM B-2242]QOD06119.1 hypothetical protein IDT60_21400 [Pseudarthrobacter sp. BIM B-2242]
MTEASIIKDRPAQLRRRPRPAPDETVDPVDYSPASTVPVPAAAPAQVNAAPATDGGGEQQEAEEPQAEPAAAPAEAPQEAATQEEAADVEPEPAVEEAPAAVAPAVAAPAAAPAKPRTSKAKAAPNKKSSRREVTFPLSTRVSQEILDLLYEAQEEHGVTLRDAIEQGVRTRWGSQ